MAGTGNDAAFKKGTAEIIRMKGYSNYWYTPAGTHGYSGQ